jgi:putative spermidine/putrescine transport system permease protein
MRATPYLLIAPALTVIVVIFAGGLGMAVSQSLGYFPAAGLTEVSLEAYGELVSRDGFARSVWLTLFVSVVTTVLTVFFAVLTALALRRYRNATILRTLYQIPITVPHLVIAVAMLMLISQSGLFSRVLHALGLISEQAQFPVLTQDRYGVGIILVYVWKQIPFVGLIALAVLQSIGENYEELARTLGANRVQTVRHVLLPLILPGLVPASIIIFAFVFGAFEVPLLLGRSYPSMLSVLAYRLYTDVDLSARPEAMATSVMIALFVLAIVIPYRRLAERQQG